MEHVKNNGGFQGQIKGRNFYGNIQIKGNILSLDITQFKKGNFYNSDITNLNLQKQFRRFLIFKKIDDLFLELLQNENLQISDENTLILPIQVQYKQRMFELKIEIPLIQTTTSTRLY